MPDGRFILGLGRSKYGSAIKMGGWTFFRPRGDWSTRNCAQTSRELFGENSWRKDAALFEILRVRFQPISQFESIDHHEAPRRWIQATSLDPPRLAAVGRPSIRSCCRLSAHVAGRNPRALIHSSEPGTGSLDFSGSIKRVARIIVSDSTGAAEADLVWLLGVQIRKILR
jgi:hypothetical protein